MYKVFISITLCLLSVLFACESNTTSGSNGNKRVIVCTTGMVGDMVTNIVGGSYDVVSLMGPGVDPHLYKATHRDIEKIQEAEIIIYNGLHLEGKLADILKKLSKTKHTYAVAETIDKNNLISGEATGTVYDPHIWFDVLLWSEATQKCHDWLVSIDNDNSAMFTENTARYVERLAALDSTVKGLIGQIPASQRVLVTAHDAFSYFGRRYGIEVRGLQGISTQSEYGIKDMSSMVSFIVDRNIKAVFVESSMSKKSMVAIIENCESKGHKVTIGGTLYSDAMGTAGTDEGTFIGMILHNARRMSEALR